MNDSPFSSRFTFHVSRYWELLFLSLILLLAAYLRLAHNTDTPGWYTDEGTHLDIARNLVHGRMQYMAITQSTLLFAKLPLFEALLALCLRIKDNGIGTLRTLTGILGVFSVGILYAIVRHIQKQPTLAMLSALMLALYPQAVLYSRFGFSYNLLVPLILLTMLGLWLYLDTPSTDHRAQRRGLRLAAVAIGIGGISDLWMFSLLLPLLLVTLARNWRDTLWSLPLALLPFGLYAFVMLSTVPRAFLFDLGFTLSRLSGVPLRTQITKLALNYTILLSQDHWGALALVGIFLLRPARLQRLTLLMFLSPILVLGRSEALYNLSFYYVIPLFPFIALGMATVLQRGLPYVAQTFYATLQLLHRYWKWRPQYFRGFTQLGAYSLLCLILLSPFLTSVLWTFQQTHNGFSTLIDPFLIAPTDARQAAGFIRHHVQPDDLVIASPGMAWLLDTRVADFQMIVAATGQATPHLPANIPEDRWAFASDISHARFVIVDNLWYTWAIWNIPGLTDILQNIETDWTLIFESGEVKVYQP